MRRMRAWVVRLGGLFHKERRERELADEIEVCLQMHIEDYVRSGLSQEEARRRALIELGGVEATKEHYRDRRGIPLLETFLRDLRFSFRMLRKNPAFTLIAVVTLTLGIGANTAIFSVVYSVLLKPLPYRDPSRLVVALHGGRFPVAPADYLDYRAQVAAFDEMAAAQAWGGLLTGTGQTERISGLQITANLIPMLGVEPMLGRAFSPNEEQTGASHVLLLSHGLWQRWFAGDPHVVGKSVLLSGEDYTIVGVMPPQFRFAPFWQTQAAMWTPLALGNRVDDRRGSSLRIFARLRSGVSIAQAQAQMDTVATRLAEAYPATNTNLGIEVVPLTEKVVGSVRPTLLLLLAAVGLVLVIACADIANLVLTRAVARKREIAVRLALGATRLQIARQLVTESLALSSLGAAAGLLVARLGLGVLNGVLPAASLPRQQEVGMDAAAFGFALALSVCVGLVSGLAPALEAFRLDLSQSLKENSRAATEGRAGMKTRGALVVVQVSVALALLVCAGLMIKSLHKLNSVDAGFNYERLLTLQVAAPPDSSAPAARMAMFKRVQDQLASLPGVESVGAINHLPINGDIWSFGYEVIGRPAPPPGEGFGAVYRVIRPGYFATMQMPLLAGRDLTELDNERSPAVVVINDTFARRQWPGEDPIGRQISLHEPDQDAVRLTIAGVVKDSRQSGWTDEPDDEMYIPYLQRPGAFGLNSLAFVVRTTMEPEALIGPARRVLRDIDKGIPLAQAQSMRQVIADKLWRSRLSALLLGLFALVALILAAVGIYGVISYSVRQRTHEIGIRMAFGAGRPDVLRLVMTESMRPVVVGLALGALAAAAATRLIASLLYEVTASDPLTYAGVILCLLGASLLAVCVPAWRAMRVDPMVALRDE